MIDRFLLSSPARLRGSTLLFLLLALPACRELDKTEHLITDGTMQVKVTLEKKNENAYSLVTTDCSGASERRIGEWKLNYPVYHFECADIDGDGTDDIAVGVIKPTRYDHISRKRVFLFKLVDGYVRPLWLGSQVGHPLEDFRVVRSGNRNLIRTIEKEQGGRYLIADYVWKSFGISFVRTRSSTTDLYTAREELANNE